MWHMSCDQWGVARKYQIQAFVPAPNFAAAMNLRLAAPRLAGIGVPPRARRVHQPRQRLQVQGIVEAAHPVKIRHASQNLGTVVSEIQPIQSLPV